jgi:hypothetical protein
VQVREFEQVIGAAEITKALCTRVSLAAVILATPLAHAQAPSPIIALACNGTLKFSDKISDTGTPVTNLGLVVNLKARTVTGFEITARIIRADEASISFSGRGAHTVNGANGTLVSIPGVTITGRIDRLTGHASATTMEEGGPIYYDLLCKPTSTSSQ